MTSFPSSFVFVHEVYVLQELEIPTVEKIPMYEQMKYKYQIYVEGHCAAMRYASMMALGSVILKVSR